MSEIGAGWLCKKVRVFAGYDWRKEHSPMVEGEVVAYIAGPSIIVRTADGQQQAWPVSLPIEIDQRPSFVREAEAMGDANGLWRDCIVKEPAITTGYRCRRCNHLYGWRGGISFGAVCELGRLIREHYAVAHPETEIGQ